MFQIKKQFLRMIAKLVESGNIGSSAIGFALCFFERWIWICMCFCMFMQFNKHLELFAVHVTHAVDAASLFEPTRLHFVFIYSLQKTNKQMFCNVNFTVILPLSMQADTRMWIVLHVIQWWFVIFIFERWTACTIQTLFNSRAAFKSWTMRNQSRLTQLPIPYFELECKTNAGSIKACTKNSRRSNKCCQPLICLGCKTLVACFLIQNCKIHDVSWTEILQDHISLHVQSSDKLPGADAELMLKATSVDAEDVQTGLPRLPHAHRQWPKTPVSWNLVQLGAVIMTCRDTRWCHAVRKLDVVRATSCGLDGCDMCDNLTVLYLAHALATLANAICKN